MKIGIISDSHDNVSNLEKFLSWANQNGIEALIHAGDLSAPSLLIKTLAPGFSGNIYMIYGNVGDKELLPQIAEEFENIRYFGDRADFELDRKKITVVHQPERISEIENVDLIIYGHTHEPEIKKEYATIVNPGSVGGLYSNATFAVYDTETDLAEIKNLN